MRELLRTYRDRLHGWNRRVLVIGGIGLGFAAVVAWALRPQAILADFAPATRGEILATIDDEGETRVREAYIVSAPVAGRLERITLEVGDSVIANETVLAVFQPQDPALLDVRALSEAEAGVRLAAADEAKARAELDFAGAELRRAEDLARAGTIPTAALDRARLAAATARAVVDQAGATTVKRHADAASARAAMATAGSVKLSSEKITYISVRSPISGRVLRRMQQSAALLAAGTPLVEIGDPAGLEIATDFLSTDAVKIREGNEVIVDEWGGPVPLAGVVRRIEPFGFTKVSALGVEEQRVNVIIDLTSPREAWSTLGHGYRVITRVVTQRAPNTLKIPVGALFRSGAAWAVFINDGDQRGGTARRRLVEIGSQNALEVEIVGGLDEGDLVIVYPNETIADGVRVAAQR